MNAVRQVKSGPLPVSVACLWPLACRPWTPRVLEAPQTPREGRPGMAGVSVSNPQRGPRVAAVLLAGLGLLLASCVVQAQASPPATRDVRVTISGLHFVPDRFDVRVGETIRFLVSNPTDLPHELFIGTVAE